MLIQPGSKMARRRSIASIGPLTAAGRLPDAVFGGTVRRATASMFGDRSVRQRLLSVLPKAKSACRYRCTEQRRDHSRRHACPPQFQYLHHAQTCDVVSFLLQMCVP